MRYAEALEHLYGLGPELAATASTVAGGERPQRKFDLAHMRALCEELGDPQRRVPAVLIAGTNGKGSAAATLASILTAAGYRTGLYTSPHLVRVNERIQLTGRQTPSESGSQDAVAGSGRVHLEQISDEAFARLYTQVNDASELLLGRGVVPQTLSFFERLTALAFLHFAEQEADVMVLEVGLGGRLDATNVVEPMLSIITDIALDHQEYLGETIAEIAAEKCGILRRHGVLVTLPQHPEANTAIGVAATALEVKAVSAAGYMPPAERNAERVIADAGQMDLPRNRYSLRVEDAQEAGVLLVDSPLAGAHQQRNLALAIAGALAMRNSDCSVKNATSNTKCYKISNAAIEAGIRETTWPGRLEFLRPNLLLDVAHNPAGAWTLRAALSSLSPDMPRTLIFSCLRDKSLSEMSRVLFPLFDASAGDPMRRNDHIILAPIASARAVSLEDLVAVAHALQIPAHAAPHLEGALMQARQVTPPEGIIVATGSVYLVGEIRRLMEGTA